MKAKHFWFTDEAFAGASRFLLCSDAGVPVKYAHYNWSEIPIEYRKKLQRLHIPEKPADWTFSHSRRRHRRNVEKNQRRDKMRHRSVVEKKLPTFKDLLEWLEDLTEEQLGMFIKINDFYADQMHLIRKFSFTKKSVLFEEDEPFLIF